MSFTALPKEISNHIVHHCLPDQLPDNLILHEIRYQGRSIQQIALIDRNFYQLVSKHPMYHHLKRVYQLIIKYFDNHTEYENALKNAKENTYPPLLFSALLAVNPFEEKAQQPFDENLKKDIEDIIALVPKSIYYRKGKVLHFENITPLVAAVINANIPSKYIRLLLEKGAKNIYIEGSSHLLRDISQIAQQIKPQRLQKIINIFRSFFINQLTEEQSKQLQLANRHIMRLKGQRK